MNVTGFDMIEMHQVYTKCYLILENICSPTLLHEYKQAEPDRAMVHNYHPQTELWYTTIILVYRSTNTAGGEWGHS